MKRSPPKRQPRLVRQLRSAQNSLGDWSQRIRVSAVQAPVSATAAVSPHAVLLAIVDDANQRIAQRLSELSTPAEPALSATTLTRRRAAEKPRSTLEVCLRACRACGRSLGAAFREAQAGADAVSASLLYGTLRDLERQLWVLNPRGAF